MNSNSEINAVNDIINKLDNDVLKIRVNNILIWNISKAKFYKTLFYVLSIIILIINASIPVINQIKIYGISSIIVSIISAIASILGGILTLVNIKESWYRYRKSTELIKTECILYINRCDPYHSEERVKIFTKNLESLNTKEREYWEDSKFKEHNDSDDKKQT